jgi:hypothetical protein
MYYVVYDWVTTSGTAEMFLVYHVSTSSDHHETICWEPAAIWSVIKATGA